MAFLKSPTGNLVLFAGFVTAGGFLLYQSNVRAKQQTSQLTRVDLPETAEPVATLSRPSSPLQLPPALPAAGPEEKSRTVPTGILPPTAPLPVGKARLPDVSKARALPISLFNAPALPPKTTGLSQTYAPYGRLIPCQTIVTLESSHLDTPVIAVVTEDVWHQGRLIIPAGAEVHGRAALDRSRERIAATGKWVIVWRDRTELNGTELVTTGIALNRDHDGATAEFGPQDGSAGLIGDLIRSDDLQEIKLFASALLGGVANGLQQFQAQNTASALTQVVTGTSRNASLQGTADVLALYARQIQEAISRDGFFVRVPAGKQFYLYVTQTLDQADGIRGNRGTHEVWGKGSGIESPNPSAAGGKAVR